MRTAFFCLHVAAPDPEFVGYDAGPQHERNWRADTLHEERRFIQEQAKTLEENGNIKVTPLLVQGPTVETIFKEASKLSADLIVVGSHGHGIVYEVLVGTVTESLLKDGSYPLLIIPARKDSQKNQG